MPDWDRVPVHLGVILEQSSSQYIPILLVSTTRCPTGIGYPSTYGWYWNSPVLSTYLYHSSLQTGARLGSGTCPPRDDTGTVQFSVHTCITHLYNLVPDWDQVPIHLGVILEQSSSQYIPVSLVSTTRCPTGIGYPSTQGWNWNNPVLSTYLYHSSLQTSAQLGSGTCPPRGDTGTVQFSVHTCITRLYNLVPDLDWVPVHPGVILEQPSTQYIPVSLVSTNRCPTGIWYLST